MPAFSRDKAVQVINNKYFTVKVLHLYAILTFFVYMKVCHMLLILRFFKNAEDGWKVTWYVVTCFVICI